MATKNASRPLGIILHRGESTLSRGRFVVIAVLGDSANEKTGAMIQVYILADEGSKPTETIRDGSDAIVCGDCPMRGILAKYRREDVPADLEGEGGKLRACYVNAGQGPRIVFETYRRGGYVEYSAADHDQFFADRMIRWGSYGEPVLIPLSIVSHLSAIAAGWTGYTHQWQRPEFQGYRPFFMASVHGEQHAAALAMGWRFFHSSNSAEPIPGTIVCPASAEAGKRLTCSECGICNGNDRDQFAAPAVSVRLLVHGGFGVMAAARHLPVLQS